MSTELKIKSKHLGAEASIIRTEEKKALKQFRHELRDARETGMNDIRPSQFKAYITYERLHNHRKWDVRNENRATFLARAYLDNRPYKTVEPSCNDINKRNVYIVRRVVAMVVKYGDNKNITREDILEWMNI